MNTTPEIKAQLILWLQHYEDLINLNKKEGEERNVVRLFSGELPIGFDLSENEGKEWDKSDVKEWVVKITVNGLEIFRESKANDSHSKNPKPLNQFQGELLNTVMFNCFSFGVNAATKTIIESNRPDLEIPKLKIVRKPLGEA